MERLVTNAAGVVPVYIPLHQLRDTKVITVNDTFLRFAGRSALGGSISKISDQQLRLYLDGLDEVSDEECQIRIVRAGLQAFHESKCQVVITSRDYISIAPLNEFERISIKPLSDEQITVLSWNWLGHSEAQLSRFERELRQSALYEMMRTPLLGTLVLLLYNQTGKLPENKIRLYENFTDLLNGGWDLVKGVQRELTYSAGQKAYFLKVLALSMHENGKRQIYVGEAKRACEKIFERKVEADRFLAELLVDGLVTRTGSSLEFSHLSFQEFYAAKALLGHSNPQILADIVRKFYDGLDWWKEVIVFYAGWVGQPREFFLRFGGGQSGRGESLKSEVMKMFPYL
jgi:predicted NACHT family NTPase